MDNFKLLSELKGKMSVKEQIDHFLDYAQTSKLAAEYFMCITITPYYHASQPTRESVKVLFRCILRFSRKRMLDIGQPGRLSKKHVISSRLSLGTNLINEPHPFDCVNVSLQYTTALQNITYQ